MIYTAILAGGLERDQVRNNIPKQFSLLGSKPILIHSLEQFLINSSVERIVIAVPENWIVFTEGLLKKYVPEIKEIVVIQGGHNKNETIRNVVWEIDRRWGIAGEDILINHDAIRPFVTQRIIDENIQAVRRYSAACTVMPTVDTIVRSKDRKTASEITPERVYYIEQTPQTFGLQKLKQVYESLAAGGQNLAVNAAKMFMECGNKIHLVAGEYSNIKIITEYDMEVAHALLKDKTT